MVTHEDMLQNPHDEDLWEYYATSQLAIVDLATGKTTPVGKAGIIDSARIAPDGRYLLVTTIHRPFSYLHQYREFPKEIEVWSRAGRVVHKVASQPLEDKVPINGVATGPRSVQWRPSAPATLLWVEALDGGDLKNRVPNRDRIVELQAPFTGRPARSLQNRAALLRHTDGRQGRHGAGGGFRTANAPRADVRDRSGQTRRAAPDLEPQ